MSYSTYETQFLGTSVGDVNNDGAADTILDAEIKASLELLEVILNDENLDNDNTNIGLVVFDTSATYKGSFAPLDDSNTSLNSELVDTLTALQTLLRPAHVAGNNTGFSK